MYKNYYVVVDDPSDKDTIHQELSNNSGSETIPHRSVDVVDAMRFSEHNGVFLLSDAEAEQLNQDPRVRDVHLSPAEMGLVVKHHGTRTAQYDKSTTVMVSGTKNWGLARCISASDNFAGLFTATTYTYNLTGKGVDFILMDTGVEPWHPEFAVNADGTGGTRCVDIDWTIYGAIPSKPTGGFMGDCDGHGTNVTSIVAGNTCGWAPDAKIYSLRIVGDGTGGPYTDITDSRTLALVDELQAWQTIRLFHQAKSIDPATGYKRPTIVNCSYGYSSIYQNMSSVTYRGVTHSTNTTSGNASLLYGTLGVNDCPGDGSSPARVSSVDAEIASTIAAGVIVVGSAGNSSHKIDVPTGIDYNNFWSGSGSNFYHRGSTPGAADGVICTGAISYSTPEHKASFSSTGPRVDVFAPGYVIAGGGSAFGASLVAVDSRGLFSTSSGATYFLNKLTGTSQASPQVAGLCALFAELRPGSTGTAVKTWITGTAIKNVLSETFYGTYISTGTYTNFAGMQGAVNAYLYTPFSAPTLVTIT